MAVNSYVCLYLSYLDALAPFTDAERGRLMTAMLSYAGTGEEPVFSGNERYIWPTIQAQIDRDQRAYEEKCEKNRRNGAKGGRPGKRMDILKNGGSTQEPRKAKEKEKEKENEKDTDGNRSRFTPPTVQEVALYCEANGFRIDPDRFVNYYTSVGWHVGRNPIKDWKAAVRSWKVRDEKDGRTAEAGVFTTGPIGCEV